MMGDFLPSMRQITSGTLRSQGFSQNKISSMLGITQASVSNYLSVSPAKAYETLSKIGVSREDADRYSRILAEDAKTDAVDAVGSLMEIWTGLLGRGTVCPIHRAMYPSLADCDVCIKEYGGKDPLRAEWVREVAEAVKDLESSSTFAAVVPQVSANLAYAPGEVDSLGGVIAVPGRIVKVKDRVKALSPPEAGASGHVSSILLLVKKVRPGIHACINLRYDPKVQTVLKKLGLKSIEIGGYAKSGTADPTAAALATRLTGPIGRFDVLVDRGGSGIEPNAYLFGAGPGAVVEVAVGISRLYSAD